MAFNNAAGNTDAMSLEWTPTTTGVMYQWVWYAYLPVGSEWDASFVLFVNEMSEEDVTPGEGSPVANSVLANEDISRNAGVYTNTFEFPDGVLLQAGHRYTFSVYRYSGNTSYGINLMYGYGSYNDYYDAHFWNSSSTVWHKDFTRVHGALTYDHWPVYIWGTLATTTTSPEPVTPTSTYTGTSGNLMPTIGFTTNAVPASSTVWESRMNSYMGTSTMDSFPLCIAAPWFEFLDTVRSGLATGTASGLFITGGLLNATTTISLSAFPTVIADIGAWDFTQKAISIIQALAWMALSLWIFLDFFKGKTDTDTL